MKQAVIYGFALAAAVFATSGVSAQKYPERRMARDGNKLYEKGDFEGAETKYRHALEKDPELEDARFNLAGALFKQESAEAAAKIYMDFASDSTAVGVRVADANYNLGNVMLTGQKIDDAIELYKQALRLNPGDMQAKYNLAYAQKLKQEQEDNQDQNQDQDQDQNQDQNQDQDQDKDQNEDQDNQDQDKDQDDQDQNEDQDNQDQDKDEGDDQEDEGDRDDQGDQPEPQQSGEGEAKISPQEAEQILEAIQDEEDKTREKVNAKEVQTVGRSGKNW